jgi:hypothetical protein
MPSFRKATAQAAYAVRYALAPGTARHTSRNDGQMHSVGTARAYQQALAQAAQWLKVNGHLNRGMDYREALEVVGQEMGHFRPDITEVYLR